MEKRHARPFVVGLAALLALFCSQIVLGEFVSRLVVDPNPAGLVVSLDSAASESGTVQLTVKNHSTVLLIVDAARSSFVAPDGQAHQLSTSVGMDFTTPLLPGASTSAALGGFGALQSGSQLKLHLVWTLGAVVESATWVWEMVDTSTAAAEETPALASEPASTTAPATASPSSAAESPNNDSLIGTVALVAGLVLLALLGWGLWSLLS